MDSTGSASDGGGAVGAEVSSPPAEDSGHVGVTTGDVSAGSFWHKARK